MIMNKYLRIRKDSVPLYCCGMLILTSFFGEQYKIAGIPIYCFFILFTILFTIMGYGKKRSTIDTARIDDLTVFGVGWIAIATLLFLTYGRSMTTPYLYCISTVLIIININNNSSSLHHIEILYRFAYLGLIITCIVCSVEFLTGTHFIKIYNDYYVRMGRGNSFGFQVNINDNASCLTACMFVPLFNFNRKRRLNTIILIWIVALLIMIGSRLALIAMISIFCMYILVSLTNKLDDIAGHQLGVIVFLIGLLAIIVFAGTITTQRFLSIISDEANLNYDLARLMFMKKALQKTDALGLLIGNGAGVTQQRIGYSIHCVFVEILCDYGVFVFSWLFYFLIKMAFSFTDSICIATKRYTSSFAICFILLGFCSSSMLRIRTIWAVFSLVWCNYRMKSIEVSRLNET